MRPSSRVIVLAAPSGAGKTTIANELIRRLPLAFGYSVSATTRKPRSGERDGQAYYFLSRAEFQRRIDEGEFLEWAEYAGELYGTLRSEVERILASGQHVVLDIEVHGARQVRGAYPHPESVSIFVIPPSPRVLIERLENRRTESPAELGKRLEIAVREVEAARDDLEGEAKLFDHVVINDDLDTAVSRVIRIVNHSDVKDRGQNMVLVLADFVRELKTEADQLKQSAKRSR